MKLDCVTIIYGKTAAVLSSLLYTVDVESALGVVRVVAVFFLLTGPSAACGVWFFE